MRIAAGAPGMGSARTALAARKAPGSLAATLAGMQRAHPVVAGSLAPMPVEIEELTAVAQQPIVVERHDHRGPPRGKGARQARRQTRQMLDVSDVGPRLVENRFRDLEQLRIRVALPQ